MHFLFSKGNLWNRNIILYRSQRGFRSTSLQFFMCLINSSDFRIRVIGRQIVGQVHEFWFCISPGNFAYFQKILQRKSSITQQYSNVESSTLLFQENGVSFHGGRYFDVVYIFVATSTPPLHLDKNLDCCWIILPLQYNLKLTFISL